ncbi:hypothetical protein CLAFUW4_01362 [Fulvia fulva]|uniref:Uncharacterized protein n=1 Tax=Passalora fulva TaxID=5499 RepID=A0A9Q8L8S6_PASFU|nr:uncharacterized protein CLAFUR5_01365 [Fulvia fulva]KAK4635767.1 hypothetical protein CLAFUR4_01363 [Fulvia fulva]KAK4638183.1 hypothetical protein CLAFUR0_01364 [Fulvia fulva]UJO12952.1 hypothetical protein CLAFUR5_01365 [Fulvia fulva]WPV10252.1 hypothetical protein CLAFUW4_01362 [Fulvia fulva]WPV23039.1 hypothetical protein CLAFUW7_01367 [Fulvia fulva]
MPYIPYLKLARFNMPNPRAIFDAFERHGDNAPAVKADMNASALQKNATASWSESDCRNIWHHARIWGRVALSLPVPLHWLDQDHFADWLEAMANAQTTSVVDAAH